MLSKNGTRWSSPQSCCSLSGLSAAAFDAPKMGCGGSKPAQDGQKTMTQRHHEQVMQEIAVDRNICQACGGWLGRKAGTKPVCTSRGCPGCFASMRAAPSSRWAEVESDEDVEDQEAEEEAEEWQKVATRNAQKAVNAAKAAQAAEAMREAKAADSMRAAKAARTEELSKAEKQTWVAKLRGPTTEVDNTGFHPNFNCDRSGMNPIVGIRYHLRGQNYDICQAEYDKLNAREQSEYEAIPPPQEFPQAERIVWTASEENTKEKADAAIAAAIAAAKAKRALREEEARQEVRLRELEMERNAEKLRELKKALQVGDPRVKRATEKVKKAPATSATQVSFC